MKVKVLRGKFEGEWQAMFHASGWSSGYNAAMAVRRAPPPGYNLVGLSLRKDRSGKRVDVKVVVRHVDRRKPEISAAAMARYMVPIRERGQKSNG